MATLLFIAAIIALFFNKDVALVLSILCVAWILDEIKKKLDVRFKLQQWGDEEE